MIAHYQITYKRRNATVVLCTLFIVWSTLLLMGPRSDHKSTNAPPTEIVVWNGKHYDVFPVTVTVPGIHKQSTRLFLYIPHLISNYEKGVRQQVTLRNIAVPPRTKLLILGAFRDTFAPDDDVTRMENSTALEAPKGSSTKSLKTKYTSCESKFGEDLLYAYFLGLTVVSGSVPTSLQRSLLMRSMKEIPSSEVKHHYPTPQITTNLSLCLTEAATQNVEEADFISLDLRSLDSTVRQDVLNNFLSIVNSRLELVADTWSMLQYNLPVTEDVAAFWGSLTNSTQSTPHRLSTVVLFPEDHNCTMLDSIDWSIETVGCVEEIIPSILLEKNSLLPTDILLRAGCPSATLFFTVGEKQTLREKLFRPDGNDDSQNCWAGAAPSETLDNRNSVFSRDLLSIILGGLSVSIAAFLLWNISKNCRRDRKPRSLTHAV